jgi:adenylate cyclase
MSISKGYEFERKFLVDELWAKALCDGKLRTGMRKSEIVQAYIKIGKDYEERIRVVDGKRAWQTAKYDTRLPVRRREEAKKIQLDLAMARITIGSIVGCKIEKTRYYVPFGGKIWEVDIFHGKNQGLILAEVELESAGEKVPVPEWAIQEVTGNPDYYNKTLAMRPYSLWGKTTFRSPMGFNDG